MIIICLWGKNNLDEFVCWTDETLVVHVRKLALQFWIERAAKPKNANIKEHFLIFRLVKIVSFLDLTMEFNFNIFLQNTLAKNGNNHSSLLWSKFHSLWKILSMVSNNVVKPTSTFKITLNLNSLIQQILHVSTLVCQNIFLHTPM